MVASVSAAEIRMRWYTATRSSDYIPVYGTLLLTYKMTFPAISLRSLLTGVTSVSRIFWSLSLVSSDHHQSLGSTERTIQLLS